MTALAVVWSMGFSFVLPNNRRMMSYSAWTKQGSPGLTHAQGLMGAS
jgi:hypothetical protein